MCLFHYMCLSSLYAMYNFFKISFCLRSFSAFSSNIKELISILIESLILMTTISIYQNYNLDKIKEILSTFLDIVQSFINYIIYKKLKKIIINL